MSNFIRYALSRLGYYYTPRTVLATIDKPLRDPWAIVAANPPFADDDTDDAYLAALAVEAWLEEDELEEL